MGLNVNLEKMLRLSDEMHCKKCGHYFDSGLKNYDIECGNPNPKRGIWRLDFHCPKCEHDFTVEYEIQVVSEKRI